MTSPKSVPFQSRNLRKRPKWPLERPSLTVQQWVAQVQAWHSNIPLRNSMEFAKGWRLENKKWPKSFFWDLLESLCKMPSIWREAGARSTLGCSDVLKPQFNARRSVWPKHSNLTTDSTDGCKRVDRHRTRSCISGEILSSTSLATQEIPKLYKIHRNCRQDVPVTHRSWL